MFSRNVLYIMLNDFIKKNVDHKNDFGWVFWVTFFKTKFSRNLNFIRMASHLYVFKRFCTMFLYKHSVCMFKAEVCAQI